MTFYHAPKHKKKSSSKRTRLLMTLFTALIMITSIMGFLAGSQNQGGEVTYNDIRFLQQQNSWTAKIDGHQVAFYLNPLEAETINISASGVEKLHNSRVLYVTFDPEIGDLQFMDLIRFELAEELPSYFGTLVIPAVGKANSTYILPVIDCRNATSSVPVLYFKKSNQTTSSYLSNCMIIEAPSAQILVRMKDRLLYGLFGII